MNRRAFMKAVAGGAVAALGLGSVMNTVKPADEWVEVWEIYRRRRNDTGFDLRHVYVDAAEPGADKSIVVEYHQDPKGRWGPVIVRQG